MRGALYCLAAGLFQALNSTVVSAQAGQGQTGATRAAAAQYIGVSLDGLFSSGWATAREEEIGQLQGGAHDPKKRGFTVQNIEMSLLGAVDPYLMGEAHLVYQLTPEGESILEVEETFLTTTALPAGLQIKAGHFFIEFGRLNARHPHAWDFVDQPIVNTRMFGSDGLRAPGFHLSWLAPLPWYAEFKAGVHNANGETVSSFLSAPEDRFASHPLSERGVDSIADLLYSFRWLNSVDLGAKTVNLGVSALSGPNATGKDTRTQILGGDLYLKWKPLRNYRGWPFAALQAEAMFRRYEAGASAGNGLPSEVLHDWGVYAEGMWGFAPRWVAALRVERADGDGGNRDDPMRDRRFRLSPALTWYPSEFSKLRFQYNYDRADHLDRPEAAFWTQFEFMLGTHPAHSF